MHLSEILAKAEEHREASFSFEYFPPKTEQGLQNLYDRIDRMYNLGPKFIDITWGAGGSIAELTCEMIHQVQAVHGLETCMHLTCVDTETENINQALEKAYKAGCTNILALRGDLPREREWTIPNHGFHYAKDLVKHIRAKYGNHFDIGVAGSPEGCDDTSEDILLDHLKEKVDEGASFIITQMFYDADNFIRWLGRVRERGITVPVIPGIMPIGTYASFLRRARHTGCKIPTAWMDALEHVKNDDDAVREIGKTLVADLCRKLLANGIYHLHFYTMNLAQATRMVLEELGWTPCQDRPLIHPLPWKQSKGFRRLDEDVRPIFWRNRPRSYVARTQDWDEFPNGRWGDSRSPAFGELDTIGLKGTNEANRKKWGEPQSLQDVGNLFIRYLRNIVDSLPWSETPVTTEIASILEDLVALNSRGLLTINSQPAIDGIASSHPVYGWGPSNGYIYQKSYLELLVHPSLIAKVLARVQATPCLTYYAATQQGELTTNSLGDGPNAVTWGVFPGREIIQPTIVEGVSFLAWRDEAFHLGAEWARCYDPKTASRALIDNIMNEWYLVNIVNNDFHHGRTIFDALEGLEVEDMAASRVY